MRSKRQPHLPGFEGLGVKEFGGTLIRGNPREARPISIKRPMHVVMRSQLAVGPRSFLRRRRQIEDLARSLGRKTGVRVLRLANSGNHLHLLLLSRSKPAFQAYLRALSGILARITLKAEKAAAKGTKFWDARPYTRIVEWGRDFKTAAQYLAQNTLEALGFIPYQPRPRAIATNAVLFSRKLRRTSGSHVPGSSRAPALSRAPSSSCVFRVPRSVFKKSRA